MSDDFDPYYKWLAIPPAEQPPNHYRLLGVPLYTDDPDVIENAADQRMSHLRSFQSGRYSQDSQRLLNEVATARVCLLNAGKKAEYDAQLRRQTPPVVMTMAVSTPPAVVEPLRPIPLPPPVPPPIEKRPPTNTVPQLEPGAAPVLQSRPARRKPAKSPFVELLKHVAASATGLLCGYLVVGFFSPAWDHYGLFHQKPVAEVPSPPKPVNDTPVIQPEEVEPPPAAKIDPAPRPEKPVEPPPVKPAVRQPDPPVAPPPSPEELARQVEEAKQQRLAKLQSDRDAAVADGKVVEALKLTAEYAQLKELDPRAEKGRIIEELRKTDHPPAETFVLVGAVMEQARQALENNQPEVAAEHATAALQLARKTADQDLVRQATKLVLEIQP